MEQTLYSKPLFIFLLFSSMEPLSSFMKYGMHVKQRILVKMKCEVNKIYIKNDPLTFLLGSFLSIFCPSLFVSLFPTHSPFPSRFVFSQSIFRFLFSFPFFLIEVISLFCEWNMFIYHLLNTRDWPYSNLYVHHFHLHSQLWRHRPGFGWRCHGDQSRCEFLYGRRGHLQNWLDNYYANGHK